MKPLADRERFHQTLLFFLTSSRIPACVPARHSLPILREISQLVNSIWKQSTASILLPILDAPTPPHLHCEGEGRGRVGWWGGAGTPVRGGWRLARPHWRGRRSEVQHAGGGADGRASVGSRAPLEGRRARRRHGVGNMPRGRRSAARNFWRGGPVEVRDGTGMAEVPDPHRHAAATPPHMQGTQAAVRRSISSRGGEAGHQVRMTLQIRRRQVRRVPTPWVKDLRGPPRWEALRTRFSIRRGVGATLPQRAPGDPPPHRAHQRAASLRSSPQPRASTPTRSTCSFPTSRCCRPPSAQKGISLSQSLSHCIVYTDNFQQAWSEKNKSIPIYMYTIVAHVKWKEQIFIFLYANDG